MGAGQYCFVLASAALGICITGFVAGVEVVRQPDVLPRAGYPAGGAELPPGPEPFFLVVLRSLHATNEKCGKQRKAKARQSFPLLSLGLPELALGSP